MAVLGQPNERQREVLEWIGQGCPARVWPDFTYKMSALALQGRGPPTRNGSGPGNQRARSGPRPDFLASAGARQDCARERP